MGFSEVQLPVEQKMFNFQIFAHQRCGVLAHLNILIIFTFMWELECFTLFMENSL